MRKILVLLGVLALFTMLVLAGCGSGSNDKKMSSRPVTKQETADKEPVLVESVSENEVVEEKKSVVPAGSVDCEQLSSAELGELLGGTWSKTPDCPQRPMMPKGVSVCRCDYDGPKQIYINVETQLYSEISEATRVYDMYCNGAAAANVTSDNACYMLRTSDLRPNFVYFLKGNYFVKVSCLGSKCPIPAVEAVAEKVAAKI